MGNFSEKGKAKQADGEKKRRAYNPVSGDELFRIMLTIKLYFTKNGLKTNLTKQRLNEMTGGMEDLGNGLLQLDDEGWINYRDKIVTMTAEQLEKEFK